MVTVTATDPGGLRDSVDVTIKLIDEDEGPEIAGDDVSRDYPENRATQVAWLPSGPRTRRGGGRCTGRWLAESDVTPIAVT